MNLITLSGRTNLHRAIWSSSKVSSRLFRESSTEAAASTRPRVVILGSGWGGYRLAKDLDKSKYEVVVVSPRNHFLFTPLLPSTTTGTLEFRCVQEPVRTIKDVVYHASRAESVDFEKKLVCCRAVHAPHPKEVLRFDLPYDKLVIAVGSKSATFGVPGFSSQEEMTPTGEPTSAFSPVMKTLGSETGTDHIDVFFLKQLQHARAIRNRILECFERASNPLVVESERKRLLTFVVVGGGPTSVEFTSELYDFLEHDVSKYYKLEDVRDDVRVVIVEAGSNLLGSFDSHLQSYVKKKFESRRIEVMTCSAVKRVCAETVELERTLAEEELAALPPSSPHTVVTELPFGICVWATGNEALDFVKSLRLSSIAAGSGRGRILVDDHLRVTDDSIPFHRDIFALGDCAADKDRPLGLLAQVANQQGKYLAAYLNRGADTPYKPFRYTFLGSMAQLGTFDAVVEGPHLGTTPCGTQVNPRMHGLFAFFAWRSAYWTYSVSITNKMLILMYWFKAFWFGRDISKF